MLKVFSLVQILQISCERPVAKENKTKKNTTQELGVFGQLVCIKINSSKLGQTFLFVLVQLTRKFFSYKNYCKTKEREVGG